MHGFCPHGKQCVSVRGNAGGGQRTVISGTSPEAAYQPFYTDGTAG